MTWIDVDECAAVARGWRGLSTDSTDRRVAAVALREALLLDGDVFQTCLDEVGEEIGLAATILDAAVKAARHADRFDGTLLEVWWAGLAVAQLQFSLDVDGRGANRVDLMISWLLGPDGPSIEDLTKRIPGLQKLLGDIMDGAMSLEQVAAVIGRVLGFEFVDAGDYYTTNRGSIQSYLGFHDLFDKLGKFGGMGLDDEKFEFRTASGVEYRLELWKGSYGAGGAFGGEIGLYTRQPGLPGEGPFERIPNFYSSATAVHQIKMTQRIVDRRTGEEYFTNAGPDKHYWNLAIRTNPAVDHENLVQIGTLEFKDREVARGLYLAMRRKGIAAQLSPNGKTITYRWE